MQKIRWFFLILLILAVVTMAVQNNAPTDIKFGWYSQQFPLSIMLLISAALGFLAGAMMTASMLRRSRKRKKAKEKDQAVQPKQQPENTSESESV